MSPSLNFSPMVKSQSKESTNGLSHRPSHVQGDKQNTQKYQEDRNQDSLPAGLPIPRNIIRRPSGHKISPLQEGFRFQLGTQMGNLQASLELPQTSWDISQGGSQLLLTRLSVTLPSIPDKEFIALTSSDDCKLNPKVPNSNRACSEKHRQKQNLTSKNGL